MVSLAAIAELSKADVTTAVAVVTELFQRYKEFITPLREAIIVNLKAAMSEVPAASLTAKFPISISSIS